MLELNGTIAEESWYDDDVTPRMFRDELFAGSGDIIIWINSPGGDCVAASQIYSMLILDTQIIGNGSVLRTAVIFFYISNEGVSLLENASHLGLPVPEPVKTVLKQLHDRSEGNK